MMSSTVQQALQFRYGEALPFEFEVVLRKDQEAKEILKRVPVALSDLMDAFCETWRDEHLRKGRPETALGELLFELGVDLASGKDSRCEGLTVRAWDQSGHAGSKEFPISAFGDIASTAAQKLMVDGVLGNDATYYYEVHARPTALKSIETAGGPQLTTKSAPLAYLRWPLSRLTDKATVVGEIGPSEFAVVYTQSALMRAEQCARAGAAMVPAVETGAVLLGWLCSCPETGEFYVLISDALEATDASQAEFSLSYSSKTWSRIQTVVKAKQSPSATRGVRLLGQCHGHNFLPAGGAPPCELCAQAKVCSRTSVFVSADDRLWSRAVFARQPWSICHIFGLNARRENVDGLFTLRGNRLAQRGYYVIPDFSPASLPLVTP